MKTDHNSARRLLGLSKDASLEDLENKYEAISKAHYEALVKAYEDQPAEYEKNFGSKDWYSRPTRYSELLDAGGVIGQVAVFLGHPVEEGYEKREVIPAKVARSSDEVYDPKVVSIGIEEGLRSNKSSWRHQREIKIDLNDTEGKKPHELLGLPEDASISQVIKRIKVLNESYFKDTEDPEMIKLQQTVNGAAKDMVSAMAWQQLVSSSSRPSSPADALDVMAEKLLSSPSPRPVSPSASRASLAEAAKDGQPSDRPGGGARR